MLKPLLIAALARRRRNPGLAAVRTRCSNTSASCGNVLNILPRIVRKAAVAAIPSNANVSVHNICTGVQLNSFGNAAGLRRPSPPTAPWLARWRQWGYRADDVVGIQINGNAVQLYVHRA